MKSRKQRQKRRNKRNPDQINANSGPMELTLTAPVDLQASPAEGQRPTFHISAYSGAAMRPGGFHNPVIVELSGLKSAGESLPILLNHDPNRIVGQANGVEITAEGVKLSGIVTGDDGDSQMVLNHAKNGFKWQASIGANIDKREFLEAGRRASVNGQSVEGPMVVARNATLREVSFVAIGADKNTSAVVAASSNPGGKPMINLEQPFADWLTAKGIDTDTVTEASKALFEAQYKAEQDANRQKVTAVAPNLDSIVEKRRADQDRIDAIVRLAENALDENPRQVEAIEALARLAIEGKWNTERFELELLRGMRPTHSLKLRNGVPQNEKLTANMIEAALCRQGGWSSSKLEESFDVQTLELSEKRFPNGMGLQELFLTFAAENGYRRMSAQNVRELLKAAFSEEPQGIRAASGFSTLSLSGILSNTANKFLIQGWMAVDRTWSRISSRRSVNDFKTATSYSLTGGFRYEKVGPTGEIKHGDTSETTYTNKAETYARMYAITRQDIINDDLGALTAVPRRLGRGAALSLNHIFWTTFLDNSSFFAAGNNNVITGDPASVLSLTGITNAEVKFMNQTDPDGEPLGIMPSILLAPPTLKATALGLMNSQAIVNGGTNTTVPDANVWRGRFRVESAPYMENSSYTGYSTTAWYLLADPEELSTIEVAFLNGRESPTVENADADFNVLGVQMRGFHDFGVATQEPRGGVRAAGA